MTMAERPADNTQQAFEGFNRTEQLELSPTEQFALDLTMGIVDGVRPSYGIKEQNVPFSERSKDYKYGVDDKAEYVITDFFRSENESLRRQGKAQYAYITEDQLLQMPEGDIASTFLIDPIDGSRPAMSGTEQACVTMVNVNGYNENATFSDIEFGITHFIKEGITLIGKKGKGVWKRYPDGRVEKLYPRENPPTELSDCSTTTESYSFNKMLTGVVYDPLLRSVGYEISAPSGSWSVASLARGHHELSVDVRDRMVRDYPDHPNIKYDPIKSKGGHPMDIAASVLIVEELGGTVTDAYGNSFNDKPLWKFDENGDWDTGGQISMIAAITPELHRKTMEKVEEGFANLGIIRSL